MHHLLSLAPDAFFCFAAAVWLTSYAVRSLTATAAAYRADENGEPV